MLHVNFEFRKHITTLRIWIEIELVRYKKVHQNHRICNFSNITILMMNFISSSIMQETVMFEPASNRMYQPMKKLIANLWKCYYTALHPTSNPIGCDILEITNIEFLVYVNIVNLLHVNWFSHFYTYFRSSIIVVHLIRIIIKCSFPSVPYLVWICKRKCIQCHSI